MFTCNSTEQHETHAEFLWRIQKMAILTKQLSDVHILRILHELNRLKKVSKYLILVRAHTIPKTLRKELLLIN